MITVFPGRFVFNSYNYTGVAYGYELITFPYYKNTINYKYTFPFSMYIYLFLWYILQICRPCIFKCISTFIKRPSLRLLVVMIGSIFEYNMPILFDGIYYVVVFCSQKTRLNEYSHIPLYTREFKRYILPITSHPVCVNLSF